MPLNLDTSTKSDTTESNKQSTGHGFVIHGEEDESLDNTNSRGYMVIGEEQEVSPAAIITPQKRQIPHSASKGKLVDGEEDESKDHPFASRSKRFCANLEAVVIQRPVSALDILATTTTITLEDTINQNLETPRDPRFPRKFFTNIAQAELPNIKRDGITAPTQIATIDQHISESQNPKPLSLLARFVNFIKKQLANIKNWFGGNKATTQENKETKQKQLSSFATMFPHSSIKPTAENIQIFGTGHVFTPAPRKTYFSKPTSNKQHINFQQQTLPTINN